MSRWCGKRSTRTRFARSRDCGSIRARPCMCGERPDMADGTTTLSGRAENGYVPTLEAEPPRSSPAAFGVPAFMAPRSLAEIKELARLIALAEWAPECYRDLDGNYLQPKIELAIL